MCSTNNQFKIRIGVIGGAGHVGLPLAIALANEGFSTFIYDTSETRIEQVNRGQMPFMEDGGPEALNQALSSGLLTASSQPDHLKDCEFLVVVVGTPVDEHLNPTFSAIYSTIHSLMPHLRSGQVIVLRSTVFPGMSEHINNMLKAAHCQVDVSFCPERVAQGHSLKEFRTLPQIISAFNSETLSRVREIFSAFTSDIIEVPPMEAELAKLMTNAWRYLQFAAANQFFMIAEKNGLNFERVLHACRHNYPRMQGMPGPGLAAGPCLVKDTMQLAAYSQNSFGLGHSAMLVNEGLPAFMIEMASKKADLTKQTVGILGMAFKAESDDSRDSLSYKLRKLLSFKAAEVLCSDPYIKDPSFVSQDELMEKCGVIFIATPHKCYRNLIIPNAAVVIDIWNCLSQS